MKASQRGIRKLEQGKFSVRVVATDPRTGFRKEVKRVVAGSHEDAARERLRILDEVRAGIDAPKERMRLREYANAWMKVRDGRWKASTKKKYRINLDRHILPALGDYWVDQVRPADVQRFVAGQVEKKIAGWTIVNQLRLLRTIAKDALAEGLTERDFCARVSPPKGKGYSYEQPNLLSAGELRALLAAIPASWRAIVLVMASTGLRWGEASALQWDDIDEKTGVIHIRRTNWKGNVDTPKTVGSHRTVGLAPGVWEELKAHRQRLFKKQHKGLRAGWVFAGRSGKHRGSPLRKVLAKACTAAGISKRLTAHGLRRTFNDLARRVSNREVVMAITGHTTDRMFEHYSLVDAKEKQAVSVRLLELAAASELPPKVEDPVEAQRDRAA